MVLAFDVQFPEPLENREVDDLSRSTSSHYGDIHGSWHGTGSFPPLS